jgi:hypothetical protein
MRRQDFFTQQARVIRPAFVQAAVAAEKPTSEAQGWATGAINE